MNNIFISYSKKDAELANTLRLALKSEGLSVWWDDNIRSGKSWEEEIYNVLKSADIILVLWTES